MGRVEMLTPILNEGKKTDILFIPLNPSEESSKRGHYFAVNYIFWNSLKESSLIKANLTRIGYKDEDGKDKFLIKIDERYADDVIFNESSKNLNNLVFSISDLAPDIVCSKSEKVKITSEHKSYLSHLIWNLKPQFALIMHRRVRDEFLFNYRNNFIDPFIEEEFNRWAEKRIEFNKINPQLKKDWGPFGRVVPDLDTFFYCIPFPSTQNGTPEQNILYWKQFKEFIYGINKFN